jgi:hypothetical protein
MNRQIFHGAAASVVYTATNGACRSCANCASSSEHWCPQLRVSGCLFLTVGSYVAWLDLGMSPTVAREISFAAGALARSEQDRTFRICRTLDNTLARVSRGCRLRRPVQHGRW